MTGRKTLIRLCALAALALPAHLAAQDAPPAVAEMTVEQVQARLQAIQQRALQEPEMQAKQAAVGEEVVATMHRVEPTFTENAARAEAMQADIAAAQEASDNERLHALNAEAQQLQQAFAAARALAMQDGALQATIQAFQGEVVAKMREMDPDTDALLARLNELNGQ